MSDNFNTKKTTLFNTKSIGRNIIIMGLCACLVAGIFYTVQADSIDFPKPVEVNETAVISHNTSPITPEPNSPEYNVQNISINGQVYTYIKLGSVAVEG